MINDTNFSVFYTSSLNRTGLLSIRSIVKYTIYHMTSSLLEHEISQILGPYTLSDKDRRHRSLSIYIFATYMPTNVCTCIYIYIFCIKKFLSTIYGIYLVLLIRKYLITSNKYQQECYRPFLKTFTHLSFCITFIHIGNIHGALVTAGTRCLDTRRR